MKILGEERFQAEKTVIQRSWGRKRFGIFNMERELLVAGGKWFKGRILLLFSHSVVSNSLQPMDCSTLGFPVLHHLLELDQTHVHWVGDAIQPSHPLSSPSPPAFNLSQHQGLFKWVSSSHQVAKVLEFQLQHQFFQWIFRTDFL